MVHHRLGIFVVSALALSGCQSDIPAKKPVTTKQSKPVSVNLKPVKNQIEASVLPEPVYIDLGPIETASLPTMPIETSAPTVSITPAVEGRVTTIERKISPTEAVTIEQLTSSSSRGPEAFVEQPSGTLNDRCDPSYWSGEKPPASLGCDRLVRGSKKKGTRFDAVEPGTYVRLDSKSEHRIEDSRSIARKVGEFGIDVTDNAFGAVLVNTGNSTLLPQGAADPGQVDEGGSPNAQIRRTVIPRFVFTPNRN